MAISVASRFILLDRERRVDAGALLTLPLFVKATHRWSHALGTHNHINVIRKGFTDRIEVALEETVTETKSSPRLDVFEDLLVIQCLSSIRNKRITKSTLS